MPTNKHLHLEVVTQEKKLLSTEVSQVTAETTSGEVTILPHHVPFLAQLKEGILTYFEDGRKKFIAIFGGFIEVSANNQVNVLADSAVRAEEIDIAEVDKAKKAADEIIRKTNVHEHDLLMAEVASRQAIIKLKAARLHQSQN